MFWYIKEKLPTKQMSDFARVSQRSIEYIKNL